MPLTFDSTMPKHSTISSQRSEAEPTSHPTNFIVSLYNSSPSGSRLPIPSRIPGTTIVRLPSVSVNFCSSDSRCSSRTLKHSLANVQVAIVVTTCCGVHTKVPLTVVSTIPIQRRACSLRTATEPGSHLISSIVCLSNSNPQGFSSPPAMRVNRRGRKMGRPGATGYPAWRPGARRAGGGGVPQIPFQPWFRAVWYIP